MSEIFAIYLRISLEDTDMKSSGKTESESITNQRSMLTDYVKRNFPEYEILEFCDDGWSGKNFERPAVKRLLEQVKCGKIKHIAVKDISRFGRDYIEVGNYLTRVFPFLGVRFIALGDNFDSVKQQDIDSLTTSFKTLVYDLYSRELSRKVRSAKKRKAERGDWICAYTPFGYIKDPTNKNRLIADVQSAETVRRMFKMAADGMNTLRITQTLNREGVPTPMLHKISVGSNQPFGLAINPTNYWIQSAVARILRNEMYMGKNIYGRHIRPQIGDAHTVSVPRESWVVVEDSHEALITPEIFEKAQKQLRNYREHWCKPCADRPLRGKVYCGICGHVMTRRDNKVAIYYCKTPTVTASYSCSKDSISEDDLTEAVLSAVRTYAGYAIEYERLIETQANRNQFEQKSVMKKISLLQGRKQQISRHAQELYENLIEGSLTRGEYTVKKSSLTDALQAIDSEMEMLEQKKTPSDTSDSIVIAQYKRYADIDMLTEEIAVELLERITVYPNGVLDIRLNYADEMARLVDSYEMSKGE